MRQALRVFMGTAWAAVICGCTASLRPLDPATRMDGHGARDVVLTLPGPCSMLSQDGPSGARPDGSFGYTLPAGEYVPRFEDAHGVFFASPTGVSVTEPEPRGTRTRAGGIYIYVHENAAGVAMQYLGDQKEGISSRQRLPEHCRYSFQRFIKGQTTHPG